MINNRRTTRKQCKKAAKRALARCKKSAAAGLLAAASVLILSWLFKKVAFEIFDSPLARLAAVCASAVFKFFMTVPIFFGFSRLICNAAANDNAGGGVFFYFEKPGRYFKSLALSAAVMIKTAIIFLMPTVLAAFGVFMYEYIDLFDIYTMLLLFLTAVAVIITFNLSIYLSARYFLCAYIFIMSEKTKIRKIMKLSVKKTADKKSEIFTAFYSMFPLFAVCVFVIPIIFVLPYTVAVFAIYGTMYLKRFGIEEIITDTVIFNTGEN